MTDTRQAAAARVRQLKHTPLERFTVSQGAEPGEVARVFEEAGIVRIPGLLAAYASDILRDVEVRVERVRGELDRVEPARYGWLTPSGGVFSDRPKAIDPQPGTRQLTVVGLDHRNSEAFRKASEDPALVRFVDAILRGDANKTGSGQCIYKEADGGTAMALHQDAIYSAFECQDVLTVYTYLTPTTARGGCIQLVPHSKDLGMLLKLEDYVDDGLPEDVCSWEHTVAVPGEPGDTLIWHWFTVHGSLPNFEGRPRPAILTRYSSSVDAEKGRDGLKQW